jgi:hypothetical protein
MMLECGPLLNSEKWRRTICGLNMAALEEKCVMTAWW